MNIKKTLCLIGACAVVVSLAACAKKAAPAETATASAELPNPMVEVTAKELSQKLGFDFNIPKGATDVKYFIYNDELGEAQFKLNGVDCVARMKPAGQFTDISGMYYKWTSEEEGSVKHCQAKCMRYTGDEGSVDVMLWFDAVPGMMYSLSAQAKDLNGFDIQSIAEEMYVPLQGDAG